MWVYSRKETTTLSCGGIHRGYDAIAFDPDHRGDDSKIQQIIKQLNKLIEVVRVENLSESDYVERGVAIKVRAEGEARQEVERTADIFRGQIIDVTADTYTIQLVGLNNKLDAFIRATGAS